MRGYTAYEVFCEIYDMQPITARQIAMNTGLSESTVRASLRTLEDLGLVTYERDLGRARKYSTVDDSRP